MPDDLDDEEKELLRKHREGRKAAQAKADGDLTVWLRNDKGEEAQVPYAKGRGFLQRAFGIDLDDEEPQDATDAAPPADDKPARPVRFGRVVGGS